MMMASVKHLILIRTLVQSHSRNAYQLENYITLNAASVVTSKKYNNTELQGQLKR